MSVRNTDRPGQALEGAPDSSAGGSALADAVKVGLGLALAAALTAVVVGAAMSWRTRRKRQAMAVMWQPDRPETDVAQTDEAHARQPNQDDAGTSGQGAAASSS